MENSRHSLSSLLFFFAALFLLGGCLPAAHKAVLGNDSESISVMTHEELYEKDEHGITALSFAVKQSNTAMIKALVQSGEDVDHIGRDGRTALIDAVILGNDAAVRTLLDLGADPNKYGYDGKTPLHIAAAKGDTEALVLLLQHNANPDTVDGSMHRSALHRAVYNQHESAARALIEHDARCDTKDKYGKTALELAASKNNRRMVDLLIGYMGRGYVDSDGNTVLHIVAKSGNTVMFENLLSVDTTGLDSVNNQNMTPIDQLALSVNNLSANHTKKLEAMRIAEIKRQQQLQEDARKAAEKAQEERDEMALLMGVGMAAAVAGRCEKSRRKSPGRA